MTLEEAQAACQHRYDDGDGRRVYLHCQKCGLRDQQEPLVTPELEGWRMELEQSLKVALSVTTKALHGSGTGPDLVAAAILVASRVVERAVESLREDVVERLSFIDQEIENLTKRST